MKRITLFLAVCLGLSVFQTASAVDSETARAANKRTAANTITTNTSATRGNTSNTKQKSDTNRNENARITVNKNARQSATVKNRAATNQHIVKQRPATSAQQKNIVSRTNAIQRTVSSSRSATRKPVSGKTMTARSAATSQKFGRITRAATLDNDKIAEIKGKDYSKCKTVYQECMDEFCANKDTTLRRCACSSRIHEFDGIKKQLTDVEDKMVEFNQRLLTVGMDKEDALAINTATEGELAFSQTDTSDSEKLLQKITQTLNNSGDSKIANNLSSISLDLDMESAWDTVDATAGISTTAKSGLALYNAAQPVCVEMAQEVCSAEELDIAERSYKLAIQNDCNTVSKAYSSQYNKTIDKVHESSALLDMARLNAHQQRNSDDILTCKRKMLEQLSDTSVCGENLYKCLDITGQYIDPSTGDAFLSTDLINLTKLLTVPGDETKWSKVPDNKPFVNFLNSKKMFLETATEQCQDLADVVWNEFIDDALAQIKLEQNAKLESIRRSCVTLISQCKTNASKSLEDFDIRSLSTFAIAADATVNTMCNDIQEACIALVNDSTDWESGLAGMSQDISTDNMLENCMTVGKTCILQKCTGIGGDFTLCNKASDTMRSSILNRSVCWQDVFNCVANANNVDYDSIGIPDPDITEAHPYLKCGNEYSDTDRAICRATHKIWGDCAYDLDYEPTSDDTPNENKIKTNTSSLLAWFGAQTSTSCKGSACPEGYAKSDCSGTCAQELLITTPDCDILIDEKNYVLAWSLIYGFGVDSCDTLQKSITTDLTVSMPQLAELAEELGGTYQETLGFCPYGCTHKDKFDNCCLDHVDGTTQLCVPSENHRAFLVQTATCDTTDTYYCADSTGSSGKKISSYCITTTGNEPYIDSDNQVVCPNNGIWVLVDSHGNYFAPAYKNSDDKYQPIYNYGTSDNVVMGIAPMYGNRPYNDSWTMEYNDNAWKLHNGSSNYEPVNFGPAGYYEEQHFYIDYLLY